MCLASPESMSKLFQRIFNNFSVFALYFNLSLHLHFTLIFFYTWSKCNWGYKRSQKNQNCEFYSGVQTFKELYNMLIWLWYLLYCIIMKNFGFFLLQVKKKYKIKSLKATRRNIHYVNLNNNLMRFFIIWAKIFVNTYASQISLYITCAGDHFNFTRIKNT